MSEAFYEIGSLARIQIQSAQILLVRAVDRPKLRREYTQRRSIPANERRRQNRPISGSTCHGTKRRVKRINLDIFDDGSLSRVERPATCRIIMHRDSAEKLIDPRLESVVGSEYQLSVAAVQELNKAHISADKLERDTKHLLEALAQTFNPPEARACLMEPVQ